ncbi:hypothetical protein BH11PLA1_BH11PLA1_13080 [soil metagenome]
MANLAGWMAAVPAGAHVAAPAHAAGLQAGEHGRIALAALAAPQAMSQLVLLIPLLPLLSVVLIALCAALRVRSKLPAIITVLCLAASFGLTAWMWMQVAASPGAYVSFGYEWINFAWGTGPAQHFAADFALYIDQLTCFWMLFVTGLGALIALYASEYMAHDVGPGYCRFFAAFSLFVFSMACLVMADNLVLLFLGWEGVGLCSYLLIGYFYKKPEAVAAAKKAFIVNRIGDLGLLLGIFTTFAVFGSVRYADIFGAIASGHTTSGAMLGGHWVAWVIPLLLTAGAFGKSAQIFFYVWLPDAMEGPTPVSALIHAATMVTAGVFLIARMFPMFALDPQMLVLSFVAWSGAITAFWAATIAMAQYDIKRIMGYSTISQLGYMFAGLGLLTTTGAAFHVFTHAFFKATLFLCCGAVMHGFAGQLDLRKLSGVMWMKGWGVVGAAMLIGCLNLAGFAFTAGFFSKDMILAQAFTTSRDVIVGADTIGWLLLLTALLTAYYTFRVWFRVFVGPRAFVPGDEHHADAAAHPSADGHGAVAADVHAHGAAAQAGAGVVHAVDLATKSSQNETQLAGNSGHSPADGTPAPLTHDAHGAHGHDFHPHAPGWAINLVLTILALASLAAAGTYFIHPDEHGWTGHMLAQSSAAFAAPGEHHGAVAAHSEGGGAAEPGSFLGYDAHAVMYYVSGTLALIGIGAAYVLHRMGRTGAATSPWAERVAVWPVIRVLGAGARRKWYVDEIYNFTIRVPLLVSAHILHLIDKLLIDGMVNLVGATPTAAAAGIRPAQSGVLNGYAVAMATGIGALILIAVLVML